jgi:hypothetical protein
MAPRKAKKDPTYQVCVECGGHAEQAIIIGGMYWWCKACQKAYEELHKGDKRSQNEYLGEKQRQLKERIAKGEAFPKSDEEPAPAGQTTLGVTA